jgi:hypothetical protein
MQNIFAITLLLALSYKPLEYTKHFKQLVAKCHVVASRLPLDVQCPYSVSKY